MAEDRRAELALAGLVRLLEHSGEGRWLLWARRHLERARVGSIDATVLDAYGGSGSFNDLVLDPENGHALERMQVPWANRLLTVLGERVYQLAYERTDERFEASWVHPPDPTVEGWRCLACGHREITDYDIEWWVARILVPAHVADSTLAQGAGLIATLLSGQVLGAAESRGDLMARANASGVPIAYRDGAMRPCPQCGSSDTAVYRWIFAGGGIHPGEDNVELRTPGHRYRSPTTAEALSAVLAVHGGARVGPGLWEVADKTGDELLDAQTDIMEALRGLGTSTYLTIYAETNYDEMELVAQREAWTNVADHTWLIPDSMPTPVMMQAYLEQGAWQMYVAPAPVGASDLPDLFKGDHASHAEAIGRLAIVAMIDAWHDNTEWRVAVVQPAAPPGTVG